jgi:Fe-S cluster assembly ATP-binding protein
MFSVRNLSVFYRAEKIVDTVSFDLALAEIVLLVGLNGSGKSTLLKALLGYSGYQVNPASEILLDGQSIKKQTIAERIQSGLFFTFQNPVALPGVSLTKLLRELKVITPANSQAKIQELKAWAKKLNFAESLLLRGLNDGFSGGEKKKIELITAFYLAKQYVFFDELDTGLDRESQKAAAELINEFKQRGLGCLVVSHSEDFIKNLHYDRKLTMEKGKIK